jgi:hypothetical protein
MYILDVACRISLEGSLIPRQNNTLRHRQPADIHPSRLPMPKSSGVDHGASYFARLAPAGMHSITRKCNSMPRSQKPGNKKRLAPSKASSMRGLNAEAPTATAELRLAYHWQCRKRQSTQTQSSPRSYATPWRPVRMSTPPL